ncbi:unnamed protein product [Auanema sp. JU1783]|nr:unnamed protein product [Auanema sp. JU1783]
MMLYVADDMDNSSLPDPMSSSIDVNVPSDSSNPSTSPESIVQHLYSNGEFCRLCSHVINERLTFYIDSLPYHSHCLRCAVCYLELGLTDHDVNTPCECELKCFMKDGLLMCKACYNMKYKKACGRCNLILMPEDIVMRAKDSIFHMSCFTCSVCGMNMRPGEVFGMSAMNELFCASHNVTFPPYTPLPPPDTSTTVLSDTVVPVVTKREMSEEQEIIDEGSRSNNSRSKRMRTSFKHHQLKTMKVYFNLNHNPDAKDLKQLAQKTGLTKRVLQVWFQNARAKYRRSMQSRDAQNHSPSMLPSLGTSIGNSSETHSATCSTHSSDMSTSPEYGCAPSN